MSVLNSATSISRYRSFTCVIYSRTTGLFENNKSSLKQTNHDMKKRKAAAKSIKNLLSNAQIKMKIKLQILKYNNHVKTKGNQDMLRSKYFLYF